MLSGAASPDPAHWIALRRKIVRQLDTATAREHVAGNARWLREHYPATYAALQDELRALYKSIT